MATAVTSGARPVAVGESSRWRAVQTALRYAGLLLIAVLLLGPFILAVLGSFKTNAEVVAFPPTFLPKVWHLDNYAQVWQVSRYFPRWFLNSAGLAVAAVVTRGLFSSMAAFAFSRLKFPGRGALFLFMLGTMMIPGQVTLVPKYFILSRMHLINTYWAVILPGLVDAFYIFLLTQFFRSIPLELEEAARIDGASLWQIYWRIMLPLSRPALAAVAIFAFQSSWNDFLWPLLVLNTEKMYTLTVGLAFLRGNNYSFYNYILAGSIITIIPILLIFAIFQRYFIEGVTMSGLKG